MCIRDSVRTDGITDVTVAESIDGKLVAYSQTTSEDLASGINQFALSSNQTMLSIRWSFESTSDRSRTCLLYTSDAADERSSVDLGGRRIINKKKKKKQQHIVTTSIA